MKKCLLVLLLLVFSFGSFAQELDKSKAMEIVEKNKDNIGLTDYDIANSIISNAYISQTSKLTLIYLQQSYKGLPVFNQLKSLAFKNGELYSNFGSRIEDLENKVKNISIFASVNPETALRTAFDSKKIFSFGTLNAATIIPGRKYDFGKAGVANENITAELLWVPIADGKEVKLAWQIYLSPKTTSDNWVIRVDAHSNKIISENNLTVYCNWDAKSGKSNTQNNQQRNFVLAKQVNKIDELQTSFFNFTTSESEKNKSTSSPTIVNSASYRVVPYPQESPLHGATRSTLVSNPWTAATGNATSLNWNSTGTADYNYTRGNNVWAQEDINGNNGTGTPATSTTASDPLSFDFPPDFNVAPTQTAVTLNQQFNTTNLFYWNNIMHDITYQYGFDEVAGNFQSNNQGRGGAGNDYVLADAQDGTGTNNANFSAPADGGSGRMQMYLWSPVPTLTVNTPTIIAGQYQAVESNFSTANKLINLGQRTGQVVYYNDNAAGTTHEACAGLPVNSVLGKIAMIDRANCNFTVKVKNAQLAGAIAVIMVNNVQGGPITMGGTDNTVTIPAVMVSINDGLTMKNQLANNLNVTLSVGQYLDGDVDNGVIAHEYTHGISNRLTGGPSQSGCLSNAEQMGEGWSDYYGLMVTQDWANSNLTSGFLSPRGIGTYVIGQLPNQSGIRSQRYCTDFDINNKVYAAGIPTEIHDLGEIWCATLWDMTWNIIEEAGTINPNLFNADNPGGNSIALKLVTEGLKLQPCSPGFIDGRNAILKADSILYGGAYNCAIREAFRRRGMGLYASQGSSASDSDQVADYTPFVTIKKAQNVDQAVEGQTVTYTTVVTSCSPVAGYNLRDTLPSNITYVSGGTYNATTRVVSFPIDFADGQTQSFSFIATVNAGSYFASQTLLDEQVTASSIPSTLTASSTTTNTWSVSTAQSQSSPNSFFTPDVATASDQKLETTSAIALGAGTSAMSFSHRYNTQASTDGGLVEISTDNGTTWSDLSNKVTAGYYNSTLASGSGNPLAGRKAWSGNSNAFIKSSINLSSYANQSAKLRFRFGSNNTTAGTGWYVDDILLKREPVVNIRSSLFNASSVRVSYSDTITKIVQTVTCTSVAVNAQPTNISACVGSDATFNVTADGTNPVYQWQVSTDGGTNYNNISGATNAALTLTAVTAGMNNNRYKVLISNACPSSATSTSVILTTNTPASVTAQPTNASVCVGANTNFSVTAGGSANTYQWQVSTDAGVTFTDITGATNATYSLSAVTAAQNGNQFHLVISSCSPTPITSAAAILTVSNQASIATQPSNTPACTGGSATFNVSAAGSSLAYQWQVSTDGGVTFTDITGATSSTLILNGVSSAMNNNRYKVFISNNCSSNITSNAGILIVSDPASLTSQPNSNIVCEGSNTSFNVTATGSNITYQWQMSTDGGVAFTDISGATTAGLTLTGVTSSMNNNRYRAVLFSCSATGLNSNAALLNVNNLANVTTQPSDINTCVGSTATFTITSGGTNVNYQWQISTDGGATYTDITGATNSTLTITGITASMNNNRYRSIASNSCPSSSTSTGAILIVSGNASITAEPVNTSTCEGQATSFSATASGSSYQWQVSTDAGVTYSNISGAISTTLNLAAVTSSMNGNKYRLVITGCSATALNSSAVTLTVNSLATIATQPLSTSTCVGNSVTLTSTAGGNNPGYQWQVSTDGGTTFTDIPGAVSSSLLLNNVTSTMNNNQYNVIVSNICTASLISNIAVLSVNDQAIITAQPINSGICPGNTANYTLSASGPGLSYQWQMSTDGGITFTNISGATSSSLNIANVTTSMNNYQYRSIVNSSCSSTGTASDAATLTVLTEAQITVQPVNFSGCANASASFTTSITGNNLSYQWQVSTDGGATYTNITGETSATLVLNNITTAMNNNRYRVVAGANPCGVTTNAALLNVLPSPIVTLTANPVRSLYPGLSTTLTASSTPTSNSYNWYKNGVLVAGVTGNTITVNFDDRGSYTAKDLNGCDNISNTLNITDSVSNTVFIYPNPNDGQFVVQYFNGNSNETRTITLFDSKGARVYKKSFAVSTAYEKMEVIARKLAGGTYLLLLSDANGKKISTGKVVRQ